MSWSLIFALWKELTGEDFLRDMNGSQEVHPEAARK